jgi:hypothetical protein
VIRAAKIEPQVRQHRADDLLREIDLAGAQRHQHRGPRRGLCLVSPVDQAPARPVTLQLTRLVHGA